MHVVSVFDDMLSHRLSSFSLAFLLYALCALLPTLTGSPESPPIGTDPSAPKGPPIALGDIWFIGDSITQSNADGDINGSPRKSLYDLLKLEHVTFSYTGHHAANVDGLPATGDTPAADLYRYHSGISGSVIGQHLENKGRVDMTTNIDSGKKFWTHGRLAVEKPQIILIMLGANDINANVGAVEAPNRISLLVDKIMSQPDVGQPTFFVSKITPNRIDAPRIARVAAFNAALPDIVAAQREKGRNIYLVDNFTPIDNDYANAMRPDNLHPNAKGNDYIGRAWRDAIMRRFNSDPDKSTTSYGSFLESGAESLFWIGVESEA